MNRVLLLASIAMLAVAPAYAKGLKWMDGAPAGLPAGAQIAVVKGNPAAAGPFTIRIKTPANFTVPPHHHPSDEVVRVIGDGTLNYGMGDKLDRSNVGALTKGYHVTMGAGMNHYVFTTDPLIVQVDGTGPFQIIYADPKDDPRTK
ncbi:MAG TPA: cupin domain-containing protein [Sphingomicrobium sp.]|nr:cupin domain-containing protein [Sphingomicrobium sp.]